MWEKLYRKMKEFGSKCQIHNDTYKKVFCKALKQKHTAALLSKIYFESDNQYAKINIPKAMQMVDIVLERKISQPKRIEVLLKKAELLSAVTPVSSENLEVIQDISDEILFDNKGTDEQKALAAYLGSHHLEIDDDISDNNLFNFLNRARINQDLPYSSRIEASIRASVMVLMGWVNIKTFDIQEALACLEAILVDKKASIEHRALAAKHLAINLCKKRTQENDQAAEKLFFKVYNDLDVSKKTRMSAALFLAIMCLEKRTNTMQDKEAIDCLMEITSSQEVDIYTKEMSKFCLAGFRFLKRTDIITDEYAIKLLKYVEDSNLPIQNRYEAMLSQVIMWYNGRTDQINRNGARRLIEDILKEKDLLPSTLISKAYLYKALILYHANKYLWV